MLSPSAVWLTAYPFAVLAMTISDGTRPVERQVRKGKVFSERSERLGKVFPARRARALRAAGRRSQSDARRAQTGVPPLPAEGSGGRNRATPEAFPFSVLGAGLCPVLPPGRAAVEHARAGMLALAVVAVEGRVVIESRAFG